MFCVSQLGCKKFQRRWLNKEFRTELSKNNLLLRHRSRSCRKVVEPLVEQYCLNMFSFSLRYDIAGAIIGNGDRKDAPFLVMGLFLWYEIIFLFLEQIPPSRAANARRFLPMSRGENGVRNFQNFYVGAWATTQYVFRRKRSKFEWSRTVLGFTLELLSII